MDHKGVSKLASVLNKRMAQTAESPSTLDFGVIQADYSLKPNAFPAAIPARDYLVCATAAAGGAITAGAHVMIAWVGNDAVVIDRYTPAGGMQHG